MHYRLVAFDFDGTLADSFPWVLKTINAVADKYRFRRIEPHALDHLRGCGTRELLAHLDLPMWKLPMVTAEMRRRMTQCAGEIRLFDGVDALLQRLAASGIETAVVTSNSQENVRRILGEHNAARVQHFECGASIFGKRAKFGKLLQRTGLAPAQVLCIGDEIRDAQAAAAAGLDFIGVSWGFTRADALAAHSMRALFDRVDAIAEALCAR
jgi:phosphoglycolate phosphatase